MRIDSKILADGRVWTNGDEAHFNELSVTERLIVKEWIMKNFIKVSKLTCRQSSNSLRKYLIADRGIVLTNNQFKEAMLECGFKPYYVEDVLWSFNISRRSPALQKGILPRG